MLKWFSSIVILLALSSCQKIPKPYFEAYKSIDPKGWSHNDTVTFAFESQDSLAKYNFDVLLRNQTSYAYANVFLFIYTEFPNGKSALDTLNYMLADPTGKWYGEVSGSLVESRITYKQTTIPYKGDYKMHVIQAMRDKHLEGITDIGLQIHKMTQPQK